MTEAIATELQFTKHAFCMWHIISKFSGWFTSILRNRYPDWSNEFYKIYKLETIKEFESRWDVTVDRFDLQDNKHVKDLYLIKKFRVPAYLRNYFFGGMTTIRRTEYINGFVKRFISSNTTLNDFVKYVSHQLFMVFLFMLPFFLIFFILFSSPLLTKKFSNSFHVWIDVAIEEIKQRNLHDDMLAIQKINVLKVKSPLEKQVFSSSYSIRF